MTMLLVGKVLKLVRPSLSKMEKDRRIRVGGELRRVCGKHRGYLQPQTMAIVDEKNCDYCEMVALLNKDTKV